MSDLSIGLVYGLAIGFVGTTLVIGVLKFAGVLGW